MKNEKLYIMAMAATGKSTFAGMHPNYHGYRVVDFAKQLPRRRALTRAAHYVARVLPVAHRFVRNRPEMIARRHRNYFEAAFEFLRSSKEPVVVLGRRGPEDDSLMPPTDGVTLGMILLPEEKHREHARARKKKHRNFLPFFHHWTTNFDELKIIRDGMIAYAKRHNIPVYASFAEAIDEMSTRSD